MEQWATECRVKTQPGRLKVATHHGPTRTKGMNGFGSVLIEPVGKTLEQYDVVITTFQTLASEFGTTDSASKKALDDSDSENDARFGSKTLKGKKGGRALFDVKWLRIVVGT